MKEDRMDRRTLVWALVALDWNEVKARYEGKHICWIYNDLTNRGFNVREASRLTNSIMKELCSDQNQTADGD
jgi:hypothetical protein